MIFLRRKERENEIHASCLSSVSGLSGGCSERRQKPQHRRDLKSTEQHWAAAYYGGDAKTLARIEADDFTVIANGQKATKAQQIAEVEGRGPVGVPQPNVEEGVRQYGDVAVITGLSGGSNMRFTAIWLKQNNSWKVVHLDYSQGD